jgi:hypothetical protein
MNQRQILVCTVGGSDKPIVTALQGAAWDHVVFVCKERSALTLTDPIETTAREGEATRPPIPEQVALEPERWSSVLVPPDDPDAIYTILIEELDRLRAASPSPDITIDFTGGTKSMSAGAVLAVAARPGLKLQVTSGQRSDLVRVIDGTQRAIALGTDRIAMDRQIAFLRETWSRFGYQEVAEGFEALVKVVKQDPGSVDDEILGCVRPGLCRMGPFRPQTGRARVASPAAQGQ